VLNRVGVAVAAVVFSYAAIGVAQVRDTKPIPNPQSQAQKPAGNGVIAGVVVSADAGRPVRRALVSLTGGSPNVGMSMQTDDRGAFRFEGLPPGSFTLRTTKGGFLASSYGQKQAGSGRPGTPIELVAGMQLNDISLPIARGGVITGVIVDEAGEPAFGVSVTAYRWSSRSGERRLEQAGRATTDDRGAYRIPALQPGQYVISASAEPEIEFGFDNRAMKKLRIIGDGVVVDWSGSLSISAGTKFFDVVKEIDTPPPASKSGFATLYYPGALQASSAATIDLALSEEHVGVDFQLQVVPFGTISGTVAGPEGPAANANVELVDINQLPGLGSRHTGTRKDGHFSFSAVPPGQYRVVATATPKGLEASSREAAMFLASDELAKNAAKRVAVAAQMAQAARLWGAAEVGFDGRDQPNVAVTLQQGMTVSGRVVFEGGLAASALTKLSVTLIPAAGPPILGNDDTDPTPGPVDATGQFTIRGVMPGRYSMEVVAGAPAGFEIKSAVFGGVDILDVPMALGGNEQPVGGLVTFSTKKTEISGTVLDSAGKPEPGVTVIVYSMDERFWLPNSRRIQAVRPGTDGRFRMSDLPPGEYRAVVVPDVETGRWFDGAYLRTLGGFQTLTLSDKATLNLTVR